MSKQSSSPIEVGQLDGARVVLTELRAEQSNEVVVIENIGTMAQPLTGWVLATLRGDRFFPLPEGTVLGPGEQLQVHSGPGGERNGARVHHWTDEAVWNNKGDTALLFGANGHEIARIGHGSERATSKGEKLLYRENGQMRIEDRKPYKEVNRGWASPESDKDPEEHDES